MKDVRGTYDQACLERYRRYGDIDSAVVPFAFGVL